MTIEALPTYLNFPESTSNLAAGPLYQAYDGSPVGYGSDCDPLTDEPDLSGFLPEGLSDLYFGALGGAVGGAAMPHYLLQDSRLKGAAAGAVAGATLMWIYRALT